MENLFISATPTTPEISLGIDGSIKISGISTPENIKIFIAPVTYWINEFKKTNPPIVTVEMRIEYLNTVTSRYFYELLVEIGSFTETGSKVTFNWYYESGDDDLKELGEEFEYSTNLKFNYITVD